MRYVPALLERRRPGGLGSAAQPHLRAFVAISLGAPLATVSLASGYVQGGLTIDSTFEGVKYLGQVIF